MREDSSRALRPAELLQRQTGTASHYEPSPTYHGPGMRSFHLVDRSCHRRKEDVSLVERFFVSNGWFAAARHEDADCVVLFTCAEMRYKVVNMVREVRRLSKTIGPSAELVVGACLPKTDPAALASVFSGRTITPTDFSALNDLPDIHTRVENIAPAFGKDAALIPRSARRAPILKGRVPYGIARRAAKLVRRYLPGRAMKRAAARLARAQRMVIHVSAGCPNRCSYCAIRFATGRVRSKPLEVIMQNISDGLRRGYRTFDFLSDSIGGYGLDLGTNLGALIERVLEPPGTFAVGISDLPPSDFIRFSPGILALCEAERIHYLYVPIQSGSDRVLRAMNRPCDMRDLESKLKEIRRHRDVFLQTGIIVGFPGETEAEFEETLRFLKHVEFDNVYVHYYCDMPNTESSGLSNKTEKAVMIERLEKVRLSGIPFDHRKTSIEWESTMAIPLAPVGCS